LAVRNGWLARARGTLLEQLSRRVAGNQGLLTERNLRIAAEVDNVAAELDQFHDLLGATDVRWPAWRRRAASQMSARRRFDLGR